jgi:hypothetical protein
MDDDKANNEALWKRRFLVFTLVRLAGLAIFFLGIAITFGDLVREGGLPVLGVPLVIIGVIDAVFSPRILKKIWERE